MEGLQAFGFGSFSSVSSGYYSVQSDEPRGLMCLESSYYSVAFGTCTTHLESGDLPVARSQLTELSQLMSWIITSRPNMYTHLGGDLNLGYRDVFVTALSPYQFLWEADGLAGDPLNPYATGVSRTHDSGECSGANVNLWTKFDYSFVEQAHFDPGSVTLYDWNDLPCGLPPPCCGGTHFSLIYSDHLLVEGRYPPR